VVLAGFSEHPAATARDSVLRVGRHDGNTFWQKAANVGWARDLYTLRNPLAGEDPYIVDAHLSAPERRLRQAIDIFAVPGLPLFPAREWLTLVDFIAGLFVRGPEFATRFESRLVIRDLRAGDSDNTQWARVMEHQRLLAAVMYADWFVVRNVSGWSMITSDIGYGFTLDASSGRRGYVVPLNRQTAVGLFPSPVGQVLSWQNGTWTILLRDMHVNSEAVRNLNCRLASTAALEIYGTDDAVVQATPAIGGPGGHPGRGPDLIVPSSAALRDHDLDYMRALSIVAKEPSPASVIRLGWPSATNWSHLEAVLSSA
jgi:hypothetical protein